jgi:CheY-like chemotaxis protein
VEDDDDSRIMITEYLLSETMEVTPVASLAEARVALGRDEFDALVCDLRLPDGDGYALVAELRSSTSRNAKIRAVGITAHTEAESRERALTAGFDDDLAKFSTPSLARKLRAIVRPKR